MQCIAFGQTSPRIVKTLDITDGLLNNAVMDIGEDSTGFMWIATSGGLCRYDAANFRRYQNQPGDPGTLSSNRVSKLLIDSQDRLWVGTDNGLNLFDPQSDTFERFFYRDDLANTDDAHRITGIFEDHDKQIWVSTTKGTFKRSALENGQFTKVESMRHDPNKDNGGLVCGIVGDKSGLVRIVTAKEVYRADGKGVPVEVKVDVGDYLKTAIIDSKGMIWLGSHKGTLFRMDPGSGIYQRIQFLPDYSSDATENRISCIKERSDGAIMVGSSHGISILDPKTEKWDQFRNTATDGNSLRDNNVEVIAESRNGLIWCGTNYSGLSIIQCSTSRLKAVSLSRIQGNSLANIVTSFTRHKQDLLIGTDGWGINRLDGKTGSINRDQTFKGNWISRLYTDGEGTVWAGSELGLSYLSAGSKNWKHFRNPQDKSSPNSSVITAMLKDQQKRFWLAAQYGLRLFSQDTEKFSSYPGWDQAKIPQVLFEDSKNNIWAGCSGHVPIIYVLRAGTNTFAPVRINSDFNKQTHGASVVMSFSEDADGNMWASGLGLGLLKYDSASDMFREYKNDTVKVNTADVFTIQTDDQSRLWMGTYFGIWLLDPKLKNLIRLGKSDVVQASEFVPFNSYRDDSTIFFGTYTGLICLKPDKIVFNRAKVNLLWTKLEINGTQIEPNDSTEILTRDIAYTNRIELGYDQKVITVGFALLNFIQPEKNLYAYKLDGIDKNWNYTRETSLTFNNLAPGSYTLLLKAGNNDNFWTEAPIRMTIVILPPLWARWWAYCLYAVVLCGGLAGVARMFWLRENIRRKMEFSKAKLDFFTNISHEIRTSLTLIKGPLRRLRMLSAENSELMWPLSIAENNAERLYVLVTELLDFRKLEERQQKLKVCRIDLVQAIANARSAFGYIIEEKKLIYRFSAVEDHVWVYVDPIQIDKVLFNLLSNACKFVDFGGAIEIEIDLEERRVHVRVTNTGQGINPNYIGKIFDNYFQEYEYDGPNTGYGIGLALSKKIMELHSGDLTVKSSLDHATGKALTCFTASFLRGSSHYIESELTTPDFVGASLVDSQVYSPVAEPGQVLPRHTVLLAEDNDELRHFLAQSLSGSFNVIQCRNGSEAWEQVLKKLPDVVVSDVMMSGIDGIELCNRIKDDDNTGHIIVIILTARDRSDDVKSGLQARADHYLTKPFDMHELELRITNSLAFRNKIRSRFSSVLLTKDFAEATVNKKEENFIRELVGIVERNISNENFGVELLSKEIGIGRTTLYKKIKTVTGMPVNDFIKSIRISSAAHLLETGQYSVGEVANLVGFSDRKHFSIEFKKIYGKTPSSFIRS